MTHSEGVCQKRSHWEREWVRVSLRDLPRLRESESMRVTQRKWFKHWRGNQKDQANKRGWGQRVWRYNFLHIRRENRTQREIERERDRRETGERERERDRREREREIERERERDKETKEEWQRERHIYIYTQRHQDRESERDTGD